MKPEKLREAEDMKSHAVPVQIGGQYLFPSSLFFKTNKQAHGSISKNRSKL